MEEDSRRFCRNHDQKFEPLELLIIPDPTSSLSQCCLVFQLVAAAQRLLDRRQRAWQDTRDYHR